MSIIAEKRHLFKTPLAVFEAYCADAGLPPYRARQVYEWVYRKGVADFGAMTNLSKDLRQRFSNDWDLLKSTIQGEQRSTDGTVKLLLRWPDGATSECVLIPDKSRRTACISSQVGCPVGCTFCASGLDGLKRQLTAGEIVEQAYRINRMIVGAVEKPAERHARRDGRDGDDADRLTNVVFMGLGEPLANYDNVVGALHVLNADWGMNIGARKITVSTVGLPSQIRRLAREKLQINLAISLHAPSDRLRQELIPWAKKIPIDDLVAAGREFFDKTGREVTLEYILLNGVNDKLKHADELVRVCRKMRCNVNLIRYNPVAGLPFERPTSGNAHRFAEHLRSRGITTHVRKSRGRDIDAACGQLRRKQLQPPAPALARSD